MIFNSLSLGSIYALIASGFTLVFGVTRIINFAHGELYMLGAMMMSLFYATLGVPFIVALAMSASTSALVGTALERFIIRRARGGEALKVLALTIGAQLIIMTGVLVIFGPQDKAVPSVVTGLITIGNITMPWERIILLIISAVIMFGLFSFLRYTKKGQAMRAIASDPEASALQGIKVNSMYTLSMGIGCMLAGAAGSVMAPIVPTNPFIGSHATIYAILVVCMAGLGNIRGAIVGGLLLGLIENFAYSVVGGFTEVISYGFVLVLLVFKPEGLFVKR